MHYCKTYVYECDKKGCMARRVFDNEEDKLTISAIDAIVISEGWMVAYGGGNSLCPRHKQEAESKYKTELQRNSKNANLKLKQGKNSSGASL